jgi:hypothetical protein
MNKMQTISYANYPDRIATGFGVLFQNRRATRSQTRNAGIVLRSAAPFQGAGLPDDIDMFEEPTSNIVSDSDSDSDSEIEGGGMGEEEVMDTDSDKDSFISDDEDYDEEEDEEDEDEEKDEEEDEEDEDDIAFTAPSDEDTEDIL